MVEVFWNNGENSKELGEGDHLAQNGDIPNDQIQEIHVPFGWNVFVSEHFGFGGKPRQLNGDNPSGMKVYKASSIGLEGEISSIRVVSLTGGIL